MLEKKEKVIKEPKVIKEKEIKEPKVKKEKVSKEKTTKEPKKISPRTKKVILGVVTGFVVVLILIAGVSAGLKKKAVVDKPIVVDNNTTKSTTETEEVSSSAALVETKAIEKESSTSANIASETTKSEDIVKIVEGYTDYVNTFLGIHLKYPNTWYAEENTQTIMTMLQNTDKNDISVTTLNLTGTLDMVNFKAKDIENTNLNVSLVSKPVENILTVDANGKMISSFNTTAIKEFDTNLKQSLILQNKEVVYYLDSYLAKTGNFDVLYSEYAYKEGLKEIITIQAVIELEDKNNLVVKVTSNNVPTNVDKVEVINALVTNLQYTKPNNIKVESVIETTELKTEK